MATQKYFDHVEASKWCEGCVPGNSDWAWSCTRAAGHVGECEAIDPVWEPVKVSRAELVKPQPLENGVAVPRTGEIAAAPSVRPMVIGSGVTPTTIAPNAPKRNHAWCRVCMDEIMPATAHVCTRVLSLADVTALDSFYRYVCGLSPIVERSMPSEQRRFRDEVAKLGAIVGRVRGNDKAVK